METTFNKIREIDLYIGSIDEKSPFVYTSGFFFGGGVEESLRTKYKYMMWHCLPPYPWRIFLLRIRLHEQFDTFHKSTLGRIGLAQA